MLLFALIAASGIARAATPVWTLSPSLETERIWTAPWRYHLGDDPQWRDPAFDDSRWPLGSSLEAPLQRSNGQWQGRGWFRLRIDASALRQSTPVVLDLVQSGASEVFLDGRRIAQFGVVGHGFEDEQAIRRNEAPPVIQITPGTHALAVRYSNFYGVPVSRIDPRAGGFAVRLVPPGEWTHDTLAHEREVDGQLMFFIAVPLLLAAIHFALFGFLPRMRESLYCALFLCALSGFTLMRLEVDRAVTVTGYLVAHRFFLIAIAVFSLLFLLTIYTTFAQPKRVVYFVLLGIGAVQLIWPLFDESQLTFRLSAAFGFIISAEVIRITILAFRRRHDGAGLVLAGLIAFGLAVLYNVLRVFDLVPEQAYSTYTLNLGILAAALGLSLFIARNYALTTKRLEAKLIEVKELSVRDLAHEREKQVLIAEQNERLELEVRDRTAELRREKGKSDQLLDNILPHEIALELKDHGGCKPRRFEEVSILFSDFSGFTSTVSAIPAHRLVTELDEIFRLFDDIVAREGLEKIKTIGDAYMAAGGIPQPRADHARCAVRAALAMQDAISVRNGQSAIKWQMRVGLHAGPVVAGVVGKRKFTFDVFGDTVNLASRMETSASPGEINVSAYFYDLIRRDFLCDYRGKLDVKGKGALDLYTIRAPIPVPA